MSRYSVRLLVGAFGACTTPKKKMNFVVISILLLALSSNITQATPPQISTTNVLLPPYAGVAHPVQLTKGCWQVRGSETGTSSGSSRSDSYDEDDLVDVRAFLSTHKLECTVTDEDLDESCHKDFKIEVKQNGKTGMRSFVFVKLLNPEDTEPMEMRVDVRVSEIKQLEILTTTKRVEVGEKEVLQVIGRDTDKNVFTSLVGLEFQWTIPLGDKFIELKTLSDANIASADASDQDKQDKSKQSALGLSTGQATVAVALGETLIAQVGLTVARTLSVCPGPLVGLMPSLSKKLKPMFCINRVGCFHSLQEFKSSPKAKLTADEYDWSKQFNAVSQKLDSNGKYSIVVQDLREPSNTAATVVYVGELDSITHHVAANASRAGGSSNTFAEWECPYFKSRGMDWPSLSRFLPSREQYKHNLSQYYLTKNKAYLFLGLARISSNVDNARVYVPPHLHEQMEFEFTSKFRTEPYLQSTLVVPLQPGEFPITLKFADKSSNFKAIVSDPLTTLPAERILMTTNCKLPLQTFGGTGSVRSKYRISFTSILSSSLVQVQNWTRVVSKPYEDRVEEQGRFMVWDELDESNQVELNVTVRSYYDRLRIRSYSRHRYVEEFAFFNLELEAVSTIGTFDCCSIPASEVDEEDWQELPFEGGMELVSLTSAIDERTSDPHVCATQGFFAERVGTTRIVYGRESPVQVTVFPKLKLSPDVAVMATNSELDVQIIGGPSPSEITVNGKRIGRHERSFKVKCSEEGLREYLVVSTNEFASVKATFVMECVVPIMCRVDLAQELDWKPITATNLGSSTTVRVMTAVLGNNDRNITIPSWPLPHVLGNGKSIRPNHPFILGLEENLEFKVEIPALKLACSKTISIKRPMQVLPKAENDVEEESTWWYWQGCQAKFQMIDGSGAFTITSPSSTGLDITTHKRQVQVAPRRSTTTATTPSPSLFDRLIFRDDNFYPEQVHTRLIGFFPSTSLDIKHAPEFLVQGSTITFEMDPIPSTIGASHAKFDWSLIGTEHTLMEWQPLDHFELINKASKRMFTVRAVKAGLVTVTMKLCSPCHLDLCIVQEKVVFVERYRSVNIFPGSTYALSQCDAEDMVLSSCVAKTNKEALTVYSNGTVIAGCSEAESIVTCTSSSAPVAAASSSQQTVHFHVFIQYPKQINIYPSDEDLQLRFNETHQLHAALSAGALRQSCRAVAESPRLDVWDLTLQATEPVLSLKSGPSYIKNQIKSINGIASVSFNPVRTGDWQFRTQVTFGHVNSTCQSQKITLNQTKKFSVYDQIKILTPLRLLLPARSLFEIETRPQTHYCSLASCGCEDFRLDRCLLQVFTLKPSGSLCTIYVYSEAMPQQQQGVRPMAHAVIVAEARSISNIQARMATQDGKLDISMVDSYGRTFTSGWSDLSNITRIVEFLPSRHVTVSSDYLIKGSRVNCTHNRALDTIKVTLASQASSARRPPRRMSSTPLLPPHLALVLYENEQLIAKVLIDKIEKQCRRQFLAGMICLDDLEFMVLLSVGLALLMALIQGYKNKEVYVFMGIVTAYFLAFS